MTGAYLVRDLHVGSTDREAIRHVRGKLSRAALSRAHRDARRTLIRAALAAHHAHQRLVVEFAL